MLEIGTKAPRFTLPGVHQDRIAEFALDELARDWLVLFFYPADFSFVCPTEVTGFHRLLPGFRAAGAAVAGVSVDPPALHVKWARELGGIDFPLLSDERREVARAWGVLDPRSDRAHRATYVLGPGGTVEFLMASQPNVGRSVEETLRVVQALRTGRACPADWHPDPARG